MKSDGNLRDTITCCGSIHGNRDTSTPKQDTSTTSHPKEIPAPPNKIPAPQQQDLYTPYIYICTPKEQTTGTIGYIFTRFPEKRKTCNFLPVFSKVEYYITPYNSTTYKISSHNLLCENNLQLL